MKLRSLFFTLALLLFAIPGSAQDGSLDSTFGINGVAFSDCGLDNDYGYDVIQQPNGQLVALGKGDGKYYVTRFNTDGSVDGTFGLGGVCSIDFGTSFENPRSIALQTDGKILVAGHNQIGNEWHLFVARVNPSGNLDAGFGINGMVDYDYGPPLEAVVEVFALPNGKVLAGATFGPSYPNLGLVRFESDGSVDSTFGTNGQLYPPHVGTSLKTMMFQPDGKLLTGGEGGNTVANFGVLRFLPNFDPDSTFGVNGKVIVDADPAQSEEDLLDIAVQTDGKIIAAGQSGATFDHYLAMVRLMPDGSVDNSFGIGGRVIQADRRGYEVELQDDGKMVVALRNPNNPALTRLNIDGSIDSSFGMGGFAVGQVVIMEMILQFDGKIITAGTAAQQNGAPSEVVLVRNNASTLVGLPEDFQSHAKVSIYPNPLEGSGQLEYSMEYPSRMTIRLVDMQGRLVASFAEDELHQTGLYKRSITLPDGIAPGLYTLMLTSDTGIASLNVMYTGN